MKREFVFKKVNGIMIITLWHITFEQKGIQAVLRPKVPDCSIPGENVSDARISLAPTINECIRGVGNEAYFSVNNRRIYAYKIVVDENDNDLYDFRYLYRNNLVSDAMLTHEYWYMTPVVPKEVRIYEVKCNETKKYTIIENKQIDRVKNILSEINYNDNIPETLSAFEIVNYFLDETAVKYVKSKLNHKVYDYNEDDQSYKIYKQLWGKAPEMFHNENDYYETSYIEKSKIKAVGVCKNFLIIEEMFSLCELLKVCDSGEFLLSTWKLIDKRYIGNYGCHLLLITDATQIPLALLYYDESNSKIHISAFEVATSVRDIGLGTIIMREVFDKYKIDTNDVILEPLNEEAERFWQKLGVKCSLY